MRSGWSGLTRKTRTSKILNYNIFYRVESFAKGEIADYFVTAFLMWKSS